MDKGGVACENKWQAWGRGVVPKPIPSLANDWIIGQIIDAGLNNFLDLLSAFQMSRFALSNDIIGAHITNEKLVTIAEYFLSSDYTSSSFLLVVT